MGVTGALLALSGCAHGPLLAPSEREPEFLRTAVCSVGQTVARVEGSVWMKVASAQQAGQFPASVVAASPDQLDLEVTNLVGGTEARVSVRGRRYTIDVPSHPGAKKKGAQSWGGIPLRWATDLFLGRVPCPPSDSGLTYSVTEQGTVEMKTSGERFFYTLAKRRARIWPVGLTWESGGSRVEFAFDDPEDSTFSPLKWEAKSSQGEVKVRWKTRTLTEAPR